MIKKFTSVLYDEEEAQRGEALGIKTAAIEETTPVCIDMTQVQAYMQTYITFEEQSLEGILIYLRGGHEIPILGDFKKFDKEFRIFKANEGL